MKTGVLYAKKYAVVALIVMIIVLDYFIVIKNVQLRKKYKGRKHKIRRIVAMQQK